MTGRKKTSGTEIFSVDSVFFVDGGDGDDSCSDPFHGGDGGGVSCVCDGGSSGGQVDLTFFQKVIYNTETLKFDGDSVCVGRLFFSAGGWGWSRWQSPQQHGY